jgi:CheY-like chemotaxis protein
MKGNILVVDDERGYREMYRYFLEPLGLSVTSVCNGQEAVEKVKEQFYDLILMDVHMPVLSGPEAVKKIKELRPDQKVVVFSSSSDPTYKMENNAVANGAVACLLKPVELTEIEEILKKAFEGSGS